MNIDFELSCFYGRVVLRRSEREIYAGSDTSMADEKDGGSDILSMVDILEGGKALEDEATAVLGASDDQNCTYPQGYVNRQALYSCLSCAPEEDSPAGICFACSLHCHDGHNLVELYTKRNFRCDCGNSAFTGSTCKLYSEKDKKNHGNTYNHNFQGKYCTCGRPYPDPEDEIDDEMIQCVVCEDWYHSRHLGTLAPVEYEEMICDACMQNLDFLRWYKSISVKSQDKSPQKKEVSEEKPKLINDKDSNQDQGPSEEKPADNESSVATSTNAEVAEASQKETDAGPSHNDSCKLQSLKTGNEGIDENAVLKATFWPSQWRKLLCRCSECQNLYNSKGVSFITNEDDTVRVYEDKGRKMQGNNSSFDKGMQALNSMDRINQVEILTEYNDMKNQLHDFFKSFVGEGKVVTKKDVEGFFEGMTARKKRRMEEGPGLQMHCK
ncbi:putative E3 ubiquitin-protein ligase UBR7 [Rhopilema esculentum]|uniref:putative E3 ubiquitin-protein ligase UBR7 n=1 Tax=Rhopilema esculentum TaxID=499914 RepID=UPI0031DF8679